MDELQIIKTYNEGINAVISVVKDMSFRNPYQNVDRATYVSKSAKLTEQALVKKLQALGYNKAE